MAREAGRKPAEHDATEVKRREFQESERQFVSNSES